MNLKTGHAWVGADQSKNRKPIAVPLNATAQGVLQRQVGKHRERVFTFRGKPLGMGQHKGMEECVEASRYREFPLARLRHTGPRGIVDRARRRASCSG